MPFGDSGTLVDRIRGAQDAARSDGKKTRSVKSRFDALATMQLGPWHIAAAAAVLMIAAAGTWWLWPRPPARSTIGYGYGYAVGPPMSLLDYYKRQVDGDMKGCWPCPPPRFARTFHDRLGQSLRLAGASIGVEALGLAYSNTISTSTVCVFARVVGEPVIVFVDRAEADDGTTVDPPASLHLFKKRIGDLVAYELTPHDAPGVFELLELTDPPNPDQ
jgi:hypothetical protein